MQIDHILTPERTFAGVQGGSKKRVLELIGKLVAQHTNLIKHKEKHIDRQQGANVR